MSPTSRRSSMTKLALLVGALLPLLLTSSATTDPPKKEAAAGEKGQLKPLLTLRGHTSFVSCVQFSPDGKQLATSSWDKTAALWDAATGERLLSLRDRDRPLVAVAFTQGGKRLATATKLGSVAIWDTATARSELLFRTGDFELSQIAASPSGEQIASVGIPLPGGSSLRVWAARTGQARPGFDGPARPAGCLAYSPDGKRLASADISGQVTVWEAGSGQKALTLRGAGGHVILSWSPDGRQLATISRNGELTIWNLASGKISQKAGGDLGHLSDALVFTPAGGHLLSAGYGITATGWVGEVRVWDRGSREGWPALRFGEGKRSVHRLCVSPDGSRLATGHRDGTVNLWSLKRLLARARLGRGG
jgi:WD40 repeat protein